MLPQKRNSNRFTKILVFVGALSLLAIFLVKFFHLSPLIFGGPQSVVEFLTNSGLESDNNRVNILLLGIGGDGHEGPYLTDTIIIASVDRDAKDVILISIPRDIWVPDKRDKINSIYANSKNDLKVTEQTISKLFGVPIHYALRIDFSGFEKAVDLVDGLDITVDNSFTDYKYPIAGRQDDTCGIEIETKLEDGIKNTYFKDATGSATLLTEENDPFICRYETLNFKRGQTHMDGTIALKFVRSRHALGDEGSDFARSARQEKVLLAFRQKVLSVGTLTNPKRIIDLMSTFGNSIHTDITSQEVPYFLKLLSEVDQSALRKISLDADHEDSRMEVGDPAFYGGYVLLPKDGSWQELADYIQGEIFKTVQSFPSPTPKKK